MPLPPPTVRVRLFAGLREAMGWSERWVSTTGEATPLTLWWQLGLPGASPAPSPSLQATAQGLPAPTAPSADGLPAGVRVAINQRFAAIDTPLVDGDELAFLPPISGG